MTRIIELTGTYVTAIEITAVYRPPSPIDIIGGRS